MPYTASMMSIEEVLRASEVRSASNGLTFAFLPDGDASHAALLERLVATVPMGLVARMRRTVCYFVPWLVKQRRGVAVSTEPGGADDERKELCHHLDIKPAGNLLLISLKFYEDDRYGLAMEFFDKVAYIATLETAERTDFQELLERQLAQPGGELTPEAAEWRSEVESRRAKSEPDPEVEANYRRAAETDALGVYMAALFTDVFFEDLFDQAEHQNPLPPDALYERVRTLERLYPPNRGYSLQIVRQRPRRRS